MEQNKKIYVIGGSIDYANWIEDLGYDITNDINESSVVMFTGGSDVSPHLYDENKGHNTYISLERDQQELKYYQFCIKNNKPMIGICRGSQFLCVMNGGKLVQDSSHPGGHTIATYDNKEIVVSSSHHQQALLTGLKDNEDYKLLGWAKKLSKYHLNGDNIDYKFGPDYKEVEIVYYPKTRSFGIQSHPEWLFGQDEYKMDVEYIQQIFVQFMDNKLA